MSPSPAASTDGEQVIAGFFTGGALAVRGGVKAARNSAIGCAVLLAVIEGVGIGFQRMMAENTRLDVRAPHASLFSAPHLTSLGRATPDSIRRRQQVAGLGVGSVLPVRFTHPISPLLYILCVALSMGLWEGCIMASIMHWPHDRAGPHMAHECATRLLLHLCASCCT